MMEGSCCGIGEMCTNDCDWERVMMVCTDTVFEMNFVAF